MYFVHNAEFHFFYKRFFKRFRQLQSKIYSIFPQFSVRHFAHSGKILNLRFILNFDTISVSKPENSIRLNQKTRTQRGDLQKNSAASAGQKKTTAEPQTIII